METAVLATALISQQKQKVKTLNGVSIYRNTKTAATGTNTIEIRPPPNTKLITANLHNGVSMCLVSLEIRMVGDDTIGLSLIHEKSTQMEGRDVSWQSMVGIVFDGMQKIVATFGYCVLNDPLTLTIGLVNL